MHDGGAMDSGMNSSVFWRGRPAVGMVATTGDALKGRSVMRKAIGLLTVLVVLLSVPAHAASYVEVNGDLQLTGTLQLTVTGAIHFPDGTTQYTAPPVFTQIGPYYNTWTGIDALASNIYGVQNTANGFQALYNNDGNYNSAFGTQALYSNTSGTDNTAMGNGALWHNTTGNGNTAIGSAALAANIDGGNNTAIGSEALLNHTGDNNTAVGHGALREDTSAFGNTAVGTTALGLTRGHSNTGIGMNALWFNIEGNSNTAIGSNAGVASRNLSNATAIGANAMVDASNKIRLGDGNIQYIEANVSVITTSDIRRKKDIQDLTVGLDFIKALRPVEFRLKSGNDRVDFGFIAQDIEALIGTEHNILGIGGDEARTLSLRYTDFIAPLVKAMQEQHEMIDKLNDLAASQQDDLQRMRQELAELKALVLRAAASQK
jgi:hypothetical protein